MPTNYERGRALEYRAQAVLAADGYYAVRSPGSKGIADILAVKKGQALMVQCKRGPTRAFGDWNLLLWAALDHGALPLHCEAAPGGPLTWWLLTGTRKPRQRVRLPREQWWPDFAERPGGAP